MQPNDFTNYDEAKSDLDDHKPINPYAKEPVKPGYSTEPTYQSIYASYITRDETVKQECFHEFDPNGLVLTGINTGMPVTSYDVSEIRNAVNRSNRGAYNMALNYRRKLQSFVCLKVFYSVVLIISLNSNFSDYREFKNFCPSYAKASLVIGIIGISWMAISLVGIYAAIQRIEKLMKAYQAGLMFIIVVTVIVVGFGIINKDDSPFCDSDPPKTITLIGLGIFTVIIVALFAFTATKMRQIMVLVPRQQPQQRIPHSNPQIEAQALAPFRGDVALNVNPNQQGNQVNHINQGIPLRVNEMVIEE